MKKSSTQHVLMVRPSNFGFNPETAANNAFQTFEGSDQKEEIVKEALIEFDNAVEKLRAHFIDVMIWQDSALPLKTDAVFPNNWFSTHDDGTLLLYPMFSPNRRLERDPALIELLNSKYKVSRDYTMEHYEEEDLFLEGTGSIVLDRANNVAYAARSIRTDSSLFDKWCIITDHKGIIFDAVDEKNLPIYHTNVMMAIGTKVAVVCLECIPNEDARLKVVSNLERYGKEIVEISYAQMNAFAGNMLELQGRDGQLYMVCSQTAFDALNENQKESINSYSKLLPITIPTIERFGGGSARCMIAEIFLNRK